MTDPSDRYEDDPRRHTREMKGRLKELVTHVRSDVGKVGDPGAEALFGDRGGGAGRPRQGVADFERRNEPAWRPDQ